jgi:hypothetical protein
LIKYLSKFFILFFLISIFLGFKHQTKILGNNVEILRSSYNMELQLYLKRNIQLSKMINQFQINDLNNGYVKKNDFLKFDRNSFSHFTVIKINYDKSE